MATPTYVGAGQPQPSDGGGLFARIGAYLGGSGTPAYVGAGQPVPVSGGLFRPVTPIYATAPVPTPNASSPAQTVEAQSVEAKAEVVACPIDPEALASGHIAIVIPRGT
jgi:hypothetical protein